MKLALHLVPLHSRSPPASSGVNLSHVAHGGKSAASLLAMTITTPGTETFPMAVKVSYEDVKTIAACRAVDRVRKVGVGHGSVDH